MKYPQSDTRHFRLRQAWLAPVILAFVLLVPSRQTVAAGLEWTIAPYLWGPDLTADVLINSGPDISVDVPLSDLISKLDMAFMGHVEARGERFGGFFDMIYMDVSDSKSTTFGPGDPIEGDVRFDTSLNLKIYEFAGLYRIGRPDPGRAEFDILLGARQVDMDQTLALTIQGPGGGGGDVDSVPVDVSETDVFGGARIVGMFNERWGYKARADYGTGGTDGTVNALATVGYTFGETGLFTLDVGYRYMKIKLSDDRSEFVSTDTEITASGPLVGFIFTF